MEVPCNLLVESFRRHTVELGQVFVQHHLLVSDEIDTALDELIRDGDFGGRAAFLCHDLIA
jgi:hypothetical protein